MTNAVNLASLAVSGALSADSSGNVGIGTTTPGQKLDVRGSGNTYLRIEDTQANGYNAATLYKNDQRQFRVGVLGTVGGFTNGALVVYDETAAAWRMVIDSSGRLLVNTTASITTAGGNGAGKLQVTIATASDEAFTVQNTGGAGTRFLQYFLSATAPVGSITHNGTGTSYNTASDYRLKENVQPLTGALAKVAALKPCTYTWKTDGSNGEGFIAHELAEICPGAVAGEKDATNEDGSIKPQGIDTSFLVATLTAAIQELKAEVDQLRAQLEAK